MLRTLAGMCFSGNLMLTTTLADEFRISQKCLQSLPAIPTDTDTLLKIQATNVQEIMTIDNTMTHCIPRKINKSYKLKMDQLTNKKHLKNVGPIRHCEPPHAHSPGVASGTACASMSTTTTATTTTTTRDRGDRYGPMEWAQRSFKNIKTALR